MVDDLIRGPVRFENRLQDDLVIARGDGTPLYNFAVAVDDAEMGITDVIRGDDHLSNTPKQLLVLEALGAEPPRYAHLPLLHGPDGKKLSKRHGAASVQELREAGYLPAAVRNYLALLGWGTDDDTTILPTEELIERFEIGRVGRASAIFDERKLRWLNGRFMRELPLDDYVEAAAAQLDREGHADAAADRERLRRACAIAQDKAQTLSEVWPLIRFLFEPPVDDPKAWAKVMGDGAAAALEAALEVLRDGRALRRADPRARARRCRRAARRQGQGRSISRCGWRSRAPRVSPGIFDSLAALGREETAEARRGGPRAPRPARGEAHALTTASTAKQARPAADLWSEPALWRGQST